MSFFSFFPRKNYFLILASLASLILLLTTSPSWAQKKKCAELAKTLSSTPKLSSPKVHEGFKAKVIAGPVRRQVVASCSLHGHIAHLENIIGYELDPRYNILSTSYQNALKFIDGADHLVRYKSEDIGLLADGIDEQDELRFVAAQGVLLAHEFKMPHSLIKKLKVLYKSLLREKIISKRYQYETGVEMIDHVLGMSIVAIQENQRDNMKEVKDLIDQLGKHLQSYQEKALKNYRHFMGDSPVFEIISRDLFKTTTLKRDKEIVNFMFSRSSKLISSKDILHFVKRKLDQGKSLQVLYYEIAQMYDRKTNTLAVGKGMRDDLNLFTARVKSSDHNWEVLGHTALIENYKYDEDGKLLFLVKQFEGPEELDRGYLLMTEDYLIATLIALSSLK